MFLWFKIKRAIYRDDITLWTHLAILLALIVLSALCAGALASKGSAFWRWSIGLGFAIVIGQVGCRYFLRALRDDYMRNPKPGALGPTRGVPSSLVGLFESLVFSVAAGVLSEKDQGPAGLLAVMGLWLGAKMLAGWNRDISVIIKDRPEREREQWLEERSRGAFAALLAGVLNLGIASVGGNIAGDGAVTSLGVSFSRAVESWAAIVLHTVADWVM